MLSNIINDFSKLSKNIERQERDKLRGTYQWRSKNNGWMFDIKLGDECVWSTNEPCSNPDHELQIEEKDLGDLVNKKIDPLGIINSGKLAVVQSRSSNYDDSRKQVQRLLNAIFNQNTINNDIKSQLLKLSPTAEEITHCYKASTKNEVINSINLGAPCIQSNSGATQWKLSKMSKAEIIDCVGREYEINLLTREHQPETKSSAVYEKSHFGEYLDLIELGDKDHEAYMAANSIPESLYDSFSYPPFFDRQAFNIPRWWIGPKNTGLKLHRDLVDNFLYQIKGKKQIFIYSPSETEYLYPVEFGGNPFYEPSAVDIFSPDLDKYPKFIKAKAIRCELSPGDMLYLPAGWWHCIKNITTSWSVNFFAVNQSPSVLKKNIHLETE